MRACMCVRRGEAETEEDRDERKRERVKRRGKEMNKKTIRIKERLGREKRGTLREWVRGYVRVFK